MRSHKIKNWTDPLDNPEPGDVVVCNGEVAIVAGKFASGALRAVKLEVSSTLALVESSPAPDQAPNDGEG